MDINKEQIQSLQEDNEALQAKNKKWISKLDDEIERNAKVVGELTQKIKVLQDDKYKLEFQLKQVNSKSSEEDLIAAEELLRDKQEQIDGLEARVFNLSDELQNVQSGLTS